MFVALPLGVESLVCNVSSYGAIGDGTTLNTHIIQQLLNNSACNEVLIPSSGVFLTGPLNVTRSSFVLTIDGVLMCTNIFSSFARIPEVPSYPCDRDRCSPLRYTPVLLLFRVTNVTIRGSGTLDGNGTLWWESRHELTAGRPRGLQAMSCNSVVIANITVKVDIHCVMSFNSFIDQSQKLESFKSKSGFPILVNSSVVCCEILSC
jgi:hypothetical protein